MKAIINYIHKNSLLLYQHLNITHMCFHFLIRQRVYNSTNHLETLSLNVSFFSFFFLFIQFPSLHLLIQKPSILAIPIKLRKKHSNICNKKIFAKIYHFGLNQYFISRNWYFKTYWSFLTTPTLMQSILRNNYVFK